MALDLKSTRDRLVVYALIAAAAAGLAGWHLLLKPRYHDLKELTDERASESRKKSALADLAVVEKRLGEYRSVLSDKKQASWVIELANDIARESGVSILSVAPLGTEETGDYARLPVRVDLRGTYFQIGQFVEKIESQDKFIKISNVRLEGSSTSEPTKEIGTSIVLTVFYPTKDLAS